MPILEVKDLKYKYDKYDDSLGYALDGVSFFIEEGTINALIGKSGSGKSTLISHLNGLYKADSGKIFYKNNNIYDKGFDLTKLRFSCGIVYQYAEYQLFSETVIDDVAFGAIKKGLNKEEAYEKAKEVLELLDILHLKNESPFNLSGGEKRKVAFAGVIVMEPDILIFDEPDAGLDPISKINFYELIKKLNHDFNTTIIFITHNLDDVIEYADNVIILNEGKVLIEGKPYEVLSNEPVMNKANLEMPTSIKIYNKINNMNYKLDKTKIKFDDLVKQLTNLY